MDYTKKTNTKHLHEHIGEEITLAGWVHSRRDHGKLIFIDLRDSGGMIQTVSKPDTNDTHDEVDRLRPEWCVALSGTLKQRPEKMVNSEQDNGDLEFEITGVEVLTEAETPPFEIETDGYEVSEDIRMQYRYLDLRRNRLTDNMQKRASVLNFIRRYLEERDFTEIETPELTKSTPEGARDYVVPSRIYPGEFYALPQSPQQYKQLLMVAGLERYFQFPKCFRDEDTRGDRQPEFTQLDLEMSFASQEDLLSLTEDMYTKLIETIYPDKKVTQSPWPRLSYKEAMDQYGTDAPDLREDKSDPNELAFGWIVDFPLFDEELENGHYAPSHHMFTAPKEEDIDKLESDPASVKSYQHDMVLNGFEIGGGSIRIHDPEIQKKIFELIGFDAKQSESFGHILEAFKYGVPPHGGIAPGMDRLLMLLQGEENIREVIAFPKTGEGRDLMMGAPSEISDTQLNELHLKVQKTKGSQ